MNDNRNAFTLIEILAVLVLLGVTAAFSGMMLSSGIRQFSLQQEASATSQKAEAALARIVKELTWANPPSVTISDGGKTVEWESRHPDRLTDGLQTLTWNAPGGDLTLQGKPLLDHVEQFVIPDTASAGYLELTLNAHTTLIYLRDDI